MSIFSRGVSLLSLFSRGRDGGGREEETPPPFHRRGDVTMTFLRIFTLDIIVWGENIHRQTSQDMRVTTFVTWIDAPPPRPATQRRYNTPSIDFIIVLFPTDSAQGEEQDH